MSRLGRPTDRSKLAFVTVTASAFALLRETAVASSLGLGPELDALVLTLGVILLVGGAFTTTASSALLPELVRRADQTDGAGERLAGALVAWSAVVGVVVGTAVAISAPLIAALVQPAGVATGTTDVAVLLRATAVVAVGAFATRGTLLVVLQSRRRYLLPAGIPVVASLVTAIVAMLDRSATAFQLAAWFVAGIVFETGILALRAASARFVQVPTQFAIWRLSSPLLSRVGFSALGALVFGLNSMIDLAIAGIYEPGSVGALALASRLPLAVAGLLVGVYVTPAYTELSAAATSKTTVAQHLQPLLLKVFAITLIAAAVVAVVGFGFATVVFSGGELDGTAARSIAVTQSFYVLTIPPYVCGALTSRALLVRNQQSTVLVIGAAGAVANLLFDLVAVRLAGINGVAVATALSYCVTLSMMMAVLRRSGRVSRGGPGLLGEGAA